MNTAILIVSSASLVCSAAALLIMARTAHELKVGKEQVDTELAKLRAKVGHNARVVKTALAQMEI